MPLPKFMIIIVTVFVLTSAAAIKTKPVFSYKVYGNVANYFENENDLLSFFEFTKNDLVAEVGANNGQNIAGLSILTDSITFYAQDINAKSLNQKSFNKAIEHSNKYKNSLTNRFNLCIGSEKKTNLPDGVFDKIILSSTFHEFTFMDEMILDIKTKLKKNGKVYILESECLTKSHKNYTANATTAIMERHNFHLVKKDEKNINGATGLYRTVYVKKN
jgi:ubiquinone/menaquinone biosynthesis C-methylase UbiE